jgi:hypothetical protein
MHSILDQHEVIAWDMDGTLVDGPNAAKFLSYLALTPNKRHHVITFRNRLWANQVWAELRASGLDSATFIRSVESCPEPIHDCFMIEHRMDGRDVRQRYMAMAKITDAEFFDNADKFVEWKGERAKAMGCTLLVDDMPAWVKPGCEKHGVDFLHSHAVWPKS